jgi:hypothetical protein
MNITLLLLLGIMGIGLLAIAALTASLTVWLIVRQKRSIQ